MNTTLHIFLVVTLVIPLVKCFGLVSELCHGNFTSKVNASGTVSFDPGVRTAQDPATGVFGESVSYSLPNATWLLTVQQYGDLNEDIGGVSLWLDHGAQSYQYDIGTLFDGCAFVLPSPANNTILLGQHDPGDCSVMLTTGCRTALVAKAVEAAKYQLDYASPFPNSNISSGILPSLCQRIATYISPLDNLSPSNNLPDECWNDFGIDPQNPQGPATQVQVLTLTGPNNSYSDTSFSGNYTVFPNLNYSCPTYSETGAIYWQTNANFLTSWDYAMHRAYPILSLFFKVADGDIAAFYDTENPPAAQLSCPRPANYSKGTRVPPRLPEGTPTSNKIPSSSYYSLPFGDAAGIIAGCIAAFMFTIGAGLFLYLRHRKLRRQQDLAALVGDEKAASDQTLPGSPSEADPGAILISEADPTAFTKAEILGYEVYELESSTAELDSTGSYAPKI